MGIAKHCSFPKHEELESAIRFFFSEKKIPLSCWKTRFLVLFSGGIDSSVLLESLIRICPYKSQIQALHINYQLRGKESEKESQGIYRICQEKKISLHQFVYPLSSHKGKKEANNIQSQARFLRYQEALKISTREKCNYILTAHHQDDNLETFFYKLLKGQSPSALVSMFRKKNVITFSINEKNQEDQRCREISVLHPLQNISKEAIKKYAQQNHIHFFIDSTNTDTGYARNFLRNRVMPLLDEKFPAWRNNVIRSIRLLETSNHLLDENLSSRMKDLPAFLSFGDNTRNNIWKFSGFILSPVFKELPVNHKEYILHRALYQHFPERRFSYAEIIALVNKINSGNRDKKLFTHQFFTTEGKLLLQEVVFSRGWIGPLIKVKDVKDIREANILFKIIIQKENTRNDGDKTKKSYKKIFEKTIGLIMGKRGILAPQILIISNQSMSNSQNFNNSVYKLKITIPHHLLSQISHLKTGETNGNKNWHIVPLTNYKKSLRIAISAGKERTLKKYLEAEKYPAPVRSSLLGLSWKETLLGIIDLWDYRSYRNSGTQNYKKMVNNYFISFHR